MLTKPESLVWNSNAFSTIQRHLAGVNLSPRKPESRNYVILYLLWTLSSLPARSVGNSVSARTGDIPTLQSWLICWCFTHWGSCQCWLWTILLPFLFLDHGMTSLPWVHCAWVGLDGLFRPVSCKWKWRSWGKDTEKLILYYPWPHETILAACLYLILFRWCSKLTWCGSWGLKKILALTNLLWGIGQVT